MTERDRHELEAAAEDERSDHNMGRREFLARTAGLAGLAGLATVLPAETLISQAAKVQTQHGFPSPRNIPIDTFVVLMMENRSFDHYLGGSRTPTERTRASATRTSRASSTRPSLAPDFQGCGFADPDHSWEGGREEYNHGKLDGFYIANDSYAIGYYNKPDLPFLPHIAKAFTLYDRYFASLLGPTYPNRYYMWSAQSGGQITNSIPAGGNNFETIFDRAQAAGLSVGYYASDLPFAALFGKRAVPWMRHVADFYTDAEAGNLPNIAFVDPPFNGEEQGISGDEHPHGDTGTARPSCRRSRTPSSTRRSSGGARCSSTTTSGAGSSTTSARASSRTPDRATSSRRTSASRASAFPASRSLPT